MVSSFCLEGVQRRKSRRVPATFLNLNGTGKSQPSRVSGPGDARKSTLEEAQASVKR